MLFFDCQNYCAVPEEGTFKNRLYLISTDRLDELLLSKNIHCEPRNAEVLRIWRKKKMQKLIVQPALKGMSISYYPPFSGKILQSSDTATLATVCGNEYYVNSKSLVNYVVRMVTCRNNYAEMHQKYESEQDAENPASTYLANHAVSALGQCQDALPADIWELIHRCSQSIEDAINSFPKQLQASKALKSSLERMVENTSKTFKEHRLLLARSGILGTHESEVLSHRTLPSVAMIQKRLKNPISLAPEVSVSEAIGKRESMEDAHLYVNLPEGLIAAIFDGHGGAEVAQFAAQIWQEWFLKFLKESSDPYQALTQTAGLLNEIILSRPEWQFQGCTALICFIDPAGVVYTATIGDSLAKLYHKDLIGNYKSHPLSCVRDWSHPTEAKRAAQALNNPLIATQWPSRINSKHLRFPAPHYGVNVSRSLGDQMFSQMNGHPGVISKPKITVNLIEKGDFLILGCDGLWDFVSEMEMVKLINAVPCQSLAAHLVEYALDTCNSNDNVTVMALKF